MENSELILPPVLVVGCGGIGSWLVHTLAPLLKIRDSLQLYDGDAIESRNLDRQFFSKEYIGLNKAEAIQTEIMARFNRASISSVPEYFQPSTAVPDNCLLLCCADNMAARLACIMAADASNGTAIIGGNEYTDADAYIYNSSLMRETDNDPRVWMKYQIHDGEGDPTAPRGCTGEAQEAAPQLIIANISAANYMLQLMWFWFAHRFQLDRSTLDFWPVLHRSNAYRHQTILYKDRLQPQGTQ